ncbi:MAG: AEC family transporter [Pseudomonadota bacterium]
MVLDSLFPVFALIVLGAVLKRLSLTTDAFLKTSDRLIYYIFFPLMLFWKIGGAKTSEGIPWAFIAAIIGALCLIFLISAAAIPLLRITAFQAGTFSQSCYRFNTYIGMAIILNAMGEAGVRDFGILVGFAIPLINVMAVSTLIWYSGTQYAVPERIRMTLRAVAANPLILACLAGIITARFLDGFPRFIENTFRLGAMVALPMALLSIGGALRFETARGHLQVSCIGAAIKLALFPFIGYVCMRVAGVSAELIQTGMLFLALPASTSIYVLSGQLNSDTQLASATIVTSTVLSFFSLSVVLVVFF